MSCIRCSRFISTEKDVKVISWGADYQLALNRILDEEKKSIPSSYSNLHYVCSKCVKKVADSLNPEPPSSCKRPPKKVKAIDWDSEVDVVKRAFSSGQSMCCLCKGKSEIVEIPRWARLLIYMEDNIFLPKRQRICKEHLNDIEALCESFKNVPAQDKLVSFTQKELYNWDEDVRTYKQGESAKQNIFSFNPSTNVDDEDYKIIIGLTKDQFNTVCLDLVHKTNRGHACTRKMVGIFLVKLRQNLSDSFLKVLAGYDTRQTVSKYITCVRELFMEFFVPNHLGPRHICREDFIRLHNTPLLNKLYFNEGEEKVAIVVDATYLYIEKSSNYTILKRSFCVHKGRHLIKPTMIVASDGYVLAVLGPHMSDGANNDSSILMHNLKKENSELKEWLKEDDVIIVDRGYRDSLTFLEDMGLLPHMPHFLKKGQKQHTVEEANESRLVTKVRWIVEKMNGDIKQIFKFLGGTIKTAHLLHIGDFFKIGCALVNAFYPRIQLTEDPEWMVNELLSKSRETNKVKEHVEKNELKLTRKCYKKLGSADKDEFPNLSFDDLMEIFLGKYQFGQAMNYIAENQLREGNIKFQLYKKVEDKKKKKADQDQNDKQEEMVGTLIRAHIWSRHKKQSRYKVWIQYDTTKTGSGSILGYYCLCPAGARTVGTCAHVAAVLVWLGRERGVSNIAPVKVPSSKVLETMDDAADRNEIFPNVLSDEDADDEQHESNEDNQDKDGDSDPCWVDDDDEEDGAMND